MLFIYVYLFMFTYLNQFKYLEQYCFKMYVKLKGFPSSCLKGKGHPWTGTEDLYRPYGP
jgi:hypothetical protein